jgi:hypothetical protein
MSRSAFKSMMNRWTVNQYYFFEKSAFAFASGFQLFFVVLCHEPILEIKIWEPTKPEEIGNTENIMLIFTTFLA